MYFTVLQDTNLPPDKFANVSISLLRLNHVQNLRLVYVFCIFTHSLYRNLKHHITVNYVHNGNSQDLINHIFVLPIDLAFQNITRVGNMLTASLWYLNRRENHKFIGHVLRATNRINTHFRGTHVNCLCQTDYPHQQEAAGAQTYRLNE